MGAQHYGKIAKFQSTLPVWGGTKSATPWPIASPNFNPPSPCGEGPAPGRLRIVSVRFQSTLPVWGGTA